MDEKRIIREKKGLDLQELMLKSFSQCEADFGIEHPDTASKMYDIGKYYNNEEKFAEAEIFLKKAAYVFLLLNSNEKYCECLKELMSIYQKLGKESAYEQTLSEKTAVEKKLTPELKPHKKSTGCEVQKEASEESKCLNVRDQNGRNELFLAIFKKAPKEELQRLIQTGADVNMPDNNQATPLMAAAVIIQTDPEITELLIKTGAKVNARDKNGRTALMLAIEKKAPPKTVRCLLKNGADVNAKDTENYTALMIAAAHNHDQELIKILIESSADTKAKDRCNRTAREIAKIAGAESEILDLLSRKETVSQTPTLLSDSINARINGIEK
jgi:hypothetical protein